MPVLDLLSAHNWIALAALVATFVLTRLSKDDTTFPLNISSRWRPVFAFVTGEVLVAATTAIYNAATAGHVTVRQALQAGAIAGLGAILTHVFGVQVLRGGRDVPVPSKLSVRPPPPPGGPSVVDVPPPPKTPTTFQRRTLSELAAVAVVALTGVFGSAGCKNVQQAENGVFTGEQILCLSATLAADVLSGNEQQVATELVQACQIAPTLTQDVITFINAFSAHRAAARREMRGGVVSTSTCRDGGTP